MAILCPDIEMRAMMEPVAPKKEDAYWDFYDCVKLSRKRVDSSEVFREIDRKIISLDKEFNKQYEKCNEIYSKEDYYDYRDKFSKLTLEMLKMNPEKLSIELTNEKSAFFTAIKGDITLFFEQYLEELEDDNEDEALVSVYVNKESKEGYSGSLKYCLNKARTILYDITSVAM